MPCSILVYVPRTSRRPKPNSRRSQDHVVLCSCLRPKTVTSAQAEQSPVPRPCHARFTSTSRERHVGPSRAVASPKTVSCSVSVYVPRTSRRTATGPKTVPCSVSVYVLRTPRWPNRTVTGPKTVSCSVPVYVRRTSRRPKPNSHQSQDRTVLCFRLRPENVPPVQPNLSRSQGPSVLCARLHPASFASAPPTRRPSQDRAALCARPRKNVTPAQAEQAARTHAVPCSGPVTPQTSRRPNPKRRRSQDRTVLRFLLFPKTVTSG